MNRRRVIFVLLVLSILMSLPFDQRICQYVLTLPRNWIYFSIRDMSIWGEAGGYIGVALVLWLGFLGAVKLSRNEEKRRELQAWANAFGFAFLTFCVTGLIEITLKFLIGRERPSSLVHFNNFVFHPFTFDPHFQSFPSGHTQAMFTFAFLVSARFRWLRVPAFIYAGLIGFSRVIQNAHFLSDVAGGILMAWLGFHLSQAIVEHWRRDGGLPLQLAVD